MKKLAKLGALALVLTLAIALPLTLTGCGGRTVNMDALTPGDDAVLVWNLDRIHSRVPGEGSFTVTPGHEWWDGDVRLTFNAAITTVAITGDADAISNVEEAGLTAGAVTLNADDRTITIDGVEWEIRTLTSSRLEVRRTFIDEDEDGDLAITATLRFAAHTA